MPGRGKPMPRGKELERGAGPVRRTALRAVSAARKAENKLRRAMVTELFPDRPPCAVYLLAQVYPGVIPDSVTGRCGGWADDVHEPLTRARGGSITDPGNAEALCRPCHEVITFRPESELGWAYDLGLIVHSWDGLRKAAGL